MTYAIKRYDFLTAFLDVSTAPGPIITRRVTKTIAPDASDNGVVVAPWWRDLVFERVACNDGTPLSDVFVGDYQKLFEQLDELASDPDEGVGACVVEVARVLLKKSLFAGVVPPRLSWHGHDAIVLFWMVGRLANFFTIGSNSLSFLQEREGKVVRRLDDIPLDAWDNVIR